MNECDHFRQLEEACDDGLPTPVTDIDLEQQWEADHTDLLCAIEAYKEELKERDNMGESQ